MQNHELADTLAIRIGARVFLYCLLNALLLIPLVMYLSIDRNFLTMIIQFAGLIITVSSIMAMLNAIMARYWIRRVPDNIAITMNPEALRSPLFLSNYLGLPALYIIMGIIIAQVTPAGLMWWFLMAAGAWLFSGFIAVAAVDKELLCLSIYGIPRKQKMQQSDSTHSRLLATEDNIPNIQLDTAIERKELSS
ncbi:MAG: hypothetical protein WBC91_21115 [Phototrophicaceae bacterium]